MRGPRFWNLQVDAHGARFAQHWEAAAEGWLPLPGSTENWPKNVTLDGKAAAVVAQQGAPVVRVATGAHAIAGTFSWARRPELLAVPASVALLQLSVDGARVRLPQRSSAGWCSARRRSRARTTGLRCGCFAGWRTACPPP